MTKDQGQRNKHQPMEDGRKGVQIRGHFQTLEWLRAAKPEATEEELREMVLPEYLTGGEGQAGGRIR